MTRTPKQWADFSAARFRGGYTPGGKARDLFSSGQALAKLLHGWGVWQPGDVLVDVGCGNGRLAMGLVKAGVTYYGLDVIENSILFCREAFIGYKGFYFHHLPVHNEHYAPLSEQDPALVTYPLADGMADVVVANSLFSHTETLAIAHRNLLEMHRILKPGGKLFSTWRLVPPHVQVDASADHTNYLRTDVMFMLSSNLFDVRDEVTGLPREFPVAPADSQTGLLAVRL